MEKLLIGLSGKKQAGKNTAANQIIAQYLNGQFCGSLDIGDRGQLLWRDGDGEGEMEIGFGHIEERLTVLAFADEIKAFCVNVLGLSHDQCWGTDEQKDTLTHLMWDGLPKSVWHKYARFDDDETSFGHWPTGPMTAREVMQVFGTDIMRAWDEDVWVRPCMRKVEEASTKLVLITDVRFPNELEAIHERGGKVIRLLRDPLGGEDKHDSETALDNMAGFDLFVPSNLTMGGQGEFLEKCINKWLKDYGLVEGEDA